MEIEYTGDEHVLEMSDGEFAITLAKDTHELINVGAAMDICVGSYASEAIDRRCTILVLRCLENYSTVGCIELRDTVVVQAKGVNNKLLRNRDRKFVINWLVNKGLSIGTDDLRLDDLQIENSEPMEYTTK